MHKTATPALPLPAPGIIHAHMMTPYFDRFVEPARPRNQLWRLVVGTIVIFAIYMFFIVLVFGVAGAVLGPEDSTRLASGISSPDTPMSAFLLLATFPGAALGTFLVVKLLHKRPVGTLFGRRANVLRGFLAAAALTLGLSVVYLALWGLWYDPVANLPFMAWLGYLPFLLVALLVQTGTEEIVFRGYLMQQLAARFRSPVIWFVLPALAFAALHYDPTNPVQTNILVILAVSVFGFAAADLTRLTGNIGAAWGFHFINNVLAIGILSLDGTITGLALYVTPYNTVEIAHRPVLLVVDVVATMIAWLVLRRLIRR